MKEAYTVILVPSTSYAIQIERLLQKDGVPCKLIPVPRHLSSDCGVCVRIESQKIRDALKIIQDAQIDFEGMHEI